MDRRVQRCEKGKCMQGPGGFPESEIAPHPGAGHEGRGTGSRKDNRKISPEGSF